MQFDAMAILAKPCSTGFVEPVARPVVDHEEQFSSSIAPDEQLQEEVERVTVEDRSELIREPRIVQCDRTEDVRRLAEPECVHSRLHANATPRLMERSVEPEACFVFEEDHTSAGAGFFLRAGNSFRSHAACFARSARASRLRGRCTENPS